MKARKTQAKYGGAIAGGYPADLPSALMEQLCYQKWGYSVGRWVWLVVLGAPFSADVQLRQCDKVQRREIAKAATWLDALAKSVKKDLKSRGM